MIYYCYGNLERLMGLREILFNFDRNTYLLLEDHALEVEMGMLVFKSCLLLILEN